MKTPCCQRLGIAAFTVLLFLLIQSQLLSAQDNEVVPNPNLETVGIPKVPASLAQRAKRYSGAYGLPLAGWDENKHEILLKGISSVSWISRIEAPDSTAKTWLYLKESGIYDFYFQPQRKYLVYNRDVDGNEAFQMYLYHLEKRTRTLLTDGNARSTEPVWSNAGKQIVYSSSPPGNRGVNLHLINPFEPNSNRLIVASTGNYLKAYDWSPDDRHVVYCEFVSNTVSKLWLLEIEMGKKQLLAPANEKALAYYGEPQFSRDGKGVYVITDQGSDFRRLAYFDLAQKAFTFLTSDIKWDVNEFQLAPDGKTLAVLTNENALSRLYSLSTLDGQRKAIPDLPTGIISDLKWHNNAVDLAFNFKSPRTPNDVYSVNMNSGKIERWAQSVTGGLATETFSLPELIRWKSFDGRMISGFLYRPPSAFTGKRPVIIDLHGGPEEQYRPTYGYDDNFFINELGVAKIYPNVRGSSGYGKTFLSLDDGTKREDAAKDIGALLDWIKKQPELDANRVLIQGGSYGGFLALLCATNYANRLRGVISDSGMANLATYIESTEGWRRDIQRAEFGDDRDPKVKAYLERTAPLHNARKITCPLLVIQGKNDPRVHVSEAEALIRVAQQNKTPIWYLLGKNEGHGFVDAANREFRLYTIILFVQEYLLK